MLVSAITSLMYVNEYFDDWVTTTAVVVGVNRTGGSVHGNQTIFNHGAEREYLYCAELNFMTRDGENVTSTSDTLCSRREDVLPVSASIEILYDPDFPQETVEAELYTNAGNSLKLTVAITVIFAVFYLAGSIYLYKSQPDIGLGLFPQSGEGDSSDIQESPEERAAKIEEKFHFRTVKEDLSNTNARSLRQDEENDDIENAEMKTDGSEIKEGDENVISANPETESNQEAPWSLVGASEIFSSWRRPTGSDSECCICLETYEAGETICCAKTTECDHVFHKDCVSSWLQKSNRCPLCRIDLMQ